MAIITRPKQWAYFPSKSEWDETDPTDRIRQSALLLLDSLDRQETSMTQRIRIAVNVLKRAIREEHKVD